MISKKFKLSKDQIAPVAMGRGGCLATDRIVVDGCRVGYMYRELPSNTEDSGWRFFAGDENDDYMANLDQHGIFDVNTLVNYDPEIVPFLDANYGSRFERDSNGYFTLLDD